MTPESAPQFDRARMYGHRARIGYTSPPLTTEVFPYEFYKVVPEGVHAGSPAMWAETRALLDVDLYQVHSLTADSPLFTDDALLDALADPDYLAARHERFGGVGAPSAERSNPDVVITTVRQLPMDKIPGAIKGLVGDGKITQVDPNVRTDPPRKPESNYGSRPI